MDDRATRPIPAPASPDGTRPAAEADITGQNDTTKILVVAADTDSLMDVVSACRSRGWQLVVASDAVMAVTVARREQPDVIVLKGRLPGGGGTTAIRRLCANVHTAAIPLIALTDEADPSDRNLHDAGARNCLVGPVEAESLCVEIERYVGKPLTRTEAPSIEVQDLNRLAALDKAGLLDTPPDERFDVLTTIAAKLIGVPTALLSLVDRDRQFFKSHFGLGEPYATTRETPLSHSFCQWVVSGNEVLAVTDAREHPILQRNLAVRDLGVIAYAGAPVAEETGRLIGAFCAVDSKPHEWLKTDLEGPPRSVRHRHGPDCDRGPGPP